MQWNGLPAWAMVAGILLIAPPARAQEPAPPAKLTLGVVQLALEPDLAGNRDKMVRFIQEAKAKGCRLVVFPETALSSPPKTPRADLDAAVAALQKAAAANNLYVLFCVKYKRDDTEKPFERLLVFDPQGKLVHSYDKLWADARFTKVPGLFHIDGVPCGAAICADRWLRGVEELPALHGAKVLFELSNNYANEWIDDLGWYWYVPRALRNQVYVVLANTAKENRGEGKVGHGHSAVLAPDGGLVTAAGEESDRLLVATLDLSRATRGEALRRGSHPLLKPFWDVGLRLLDGKPVELPVFQGLTSPKVPVKIAAAQITCSRSMADNLARMTERMRTARANGADVIVFPELAVTGPDEADVRKAEAAALQAALAELQTAARKERIHVVFGMPWLEGGRRYNCAFVLGPDGNLLTRYAQLVVDRPELFAPGTSTRPLWFRVKGVPGVVTVGRDALWSEIAELAAVRGAQLHLHLSHDRATDPESALRRKQLWANLASFRTFTATVNAASPAGGGSTLWEDFHRASAGRAGGYAPHSAVRLAEAGAGEEILYATQTVPETNAHFSRMTARTHPRMKPWYVAGARAIDADGPDALLPVRPQGTRGKP